METFTGYCWLLQNEVGISQHVYITMRRWAQQNLEDAGAELLLNYPELDGNPKHCAMFKYLSCLCKITGPVVEESFDDTTKRVDVEDLEPFIGQSDWLRRRQRTRDSCLDVISAGRL